MVIEVREEQPSKAELPILVTESGIEIDVRAEQLEKAESPILVTESGMMIEVRAEQPRKAQSPILVTESGIEIEVREAQPEKAAYTRDGRGDNYLFCVASVFDQYAVFYLRIADKVLVLITFRI